MVRVYAKPSVLLLSLFRSGFRALERERARSPAVPLAGSCY